MFSSIDISQYKEMLNPSAFTWNSTEGILVILLACYLCYAIGSRLMNAIYWCAGLLVCIQIGYALSLTPLNSVIPLSTIFQYDILTAVAQVFVGTWFSDALLYFVAWLNQMSGYISQAGLWVYNLVKQL